MKTMRRVNLEAMLHAPWALMPTALARLVEWARQEPELRSGGPDLVALDGPHGGATRVGSVSVLPVYGVIEHRSDWMMELFGDGVSVEGLREALSAELSDPAVKAIVLDIDSPGGTVAGMTEFAAEIRAARGGTKPIVAVADTLAASAAYWLASQADEVVVTPSGSVGSIGVYAMHQDISRMLDEAGITVSLISAGEHKTEGNMFEPLTDEARADIQSRVDASYAQFVADVAAGRRIGSEKVEADFGSGRVLTARNALSAGMVDRIETLGQTVQRLSGAGGRRRAMAAEAGAPELSAESAEEEGAPFTERVTAFATEAEALVAHAAERARLRAKEGRPAFNTATERALRTTREALDVLLEPADPAASATSAEPVEPAPAAPVKPAALAPAARRFQSDEEWLAYLEQPG